MTSLVRLVRPLRFGPVTEVWVARWRGRRVVARRELPRKDAPWPAPPSPADRSAANHPSLARFLGVGRDADGRPYDLFAHLAGATLADRLRAPSPPAAGPRDLARLAAGLRWLHERARIAPRVHGDLGTRNVLVGDDGRWTLLDPLLLAPGTFPAGGGVVFGTLPFLAPEILAGGPPTRAADLYALGLVALRAAMPDDPPWTRARSPREALSLRAAAPPATLARTAPGLAGPLRSLVASLLADDPAARPGAGDVVVRCAALPDPGSDRSPPGSPADP
jgi:serine/threonine protein kinase